MSQPKITFDQVDVGVGENQLLTFGELFTLNSGRVIQSIHGPILPLNGTADIPFDNSAPLVSEGVEVGAATITTQHANHHVVINFSLTLDASANNTTIIIAVFRDSTCIASGVTAIDTSGRPKTYSLVTHDHPMVAGEYTYSGRVGVATAGPTWYVNSSSNGNNLGGTMSTAFWLVEVV